MESDYKLGNLSPADVYRAFAVVRHLVPGLDLEKWKTLTATEELRRDWLVVADTSGCIRGLCYVFASNRGVGPKMEVPMFGSVSLFDEQGVARRLFEVTKDRAKLEGCSTIHFWSVGPRERDSLAALKETIPPEGGLIYDLSTDCTAANECP